MLVSVDEAASDYHYNTKQHSLSLSFQFTIQISGVLLYANNQQNVLQCL